MSTSGVVVNPDVQSSFVKLSEGKREFRYIIFKIQEREVVVESAVTQDDLGLSGDDFEDSSKAAFEKFVVDLKTKTEGFTDCRYAVFDFKFTYSRVGAGTSKMDKIVFIQLCPDGASIKKKMVYASSASAIKASLGTGNFLQFQVSDESEISHKEVLTKLTENYPDNSNCIGIRMGVNTQSTSGVVVNPDVQSSFVKLSEGKREFRYIIYKIQEREVVVESAVTQDDLGLSGDDYEDSSKAAFEKFVADLKTKTEGFTDCRYAVFDFKFTCSRVGAGTSKMDKIVFIQLCPEEASIKKKMVYASSASSIKACLGTGKFIQFQVSDVSEMTHKELLSKLAEKYAGN